MQALLCEQVHILFREIHTVISAAAEIEQAQGIKEGRRR